MQTTELEEMIGLERYGDYEKISALSFEDFVCDRLSNYGFIKRQVSVPNRGDGRKGRIDLVFLPHNSRSLGIPVEIDRKTPRKKSIFKVRSFNPEEAFVITRDPFMVIKV